MLLTWLGINLYIANFTGYAFGIAISYTLNSKYTFNTALSVFKLKNFLIGNAACYILNIITIYIALLFDKNFEYFAQTLGVLIYTASGFIINKFLVFK